ncbi:MAG: hypothetical protein LBQ69_00040 [Treponema sp.]|jgi:hypothetical protein|nr:hypothetical protein [Treponema sp.]
MKYIFLFALLLCSFPVFADRAAYSQKRSITIESENYTVTHVHDWSDATRGERMKMYFSENQDIFTDQNTYAYIECISKSTNRVIFRIPSPALTHLFIAPDEKYIAGISNIMLYNPYQLVILDMDGTIIKKRHFSSVEAKMTDDDFIIFKERFSKTFAILQLRKQIYYREPFYFLDCFYLGMPNIDSEAYRYLARFRGTNHLSGNISESITNFVFWFNEAVPGLRFHYQENRLFSISINDRKNQRIEIPIEESNM